MTNFVADEAATKFLSPPQMKAAQGIRRACYIFKGFGL